MRLLRKATGIWFTGGDQQRITRALLPDGRRTPALEAIWEAYRGGAVLGGSSAGTAIMSRVMFADAHNSLDTIKYGITRGKHVAAGLGFIGDDWFVDQHFLTRGRFARALKAMHFLGLRYGIGVDEDTAVVFKAGKFDVVGYKGALVLDIDRRITLTEASGARIEGIVQADSYVGAALTTVVVRLPERRRLRAIAILPDMLPADDFRRLRVLLRLGRESVAADRAPIAPIARGEGQG